MARQLRALAMALLLPFGASTSLAAQDDLPVGKVVRAVSHQTDWLVRLPAQETLVFRGMLGGKGVGAEKGSPMMYGGGGGGVGFLASLITHAVITQSVLSSQQRAERAEADQVLEPYRTTLDQVTVSKTFQLGLEKVSRGGIKRLVEPTDMATAGAWLIESTPVFTLTQDEQAIVLDNVLLVHSADVPPAVVYKGVVRVVSHPKPAGDEQSPLVGMWTADAGRLLQQEAATLWAESLDMVLDELARGPDAPTPPQKTIRFVEGGRKKVERASLMEERCDRLVLKTLRGWLMSVPAKADAFGTPPCEITGAAQ